MRLGSITECAFCHYETKCENFPNTYGSFQFEERWLCYVCANTMLSQQMLYPDNSDYRGLAVLGPSICWIANHILSRVEKGVGGTRKESE